MPKTLYIYSNPPAQTLASHVYAAGHGYHYAGAVPHRGLSLYCQPGYEPADEIRGWIDVGKPAL